MSLPVAFEIGLLKQAIEGLNMNVIVAGNGIAWMEIPGLRLWYPFSTVDRNGKMRSANGIEVILSDFNTPLADMLPNGRAIATLSGTAYYSDSASSQTRVTGAESWIPSALQGVAVGGWVLSTVSDSNQRGIIGRWDDTSLDKGYLLVNQHGGFRFLISTTGNNEFGSSSDPVAVSEWHFVVGVYDNTAGEMFIYVDGVKATPVGVTGPLYDPVTPFDVGRNRDGNHYLQGAVSNLFLSTMALPTTYLDLIYNSTKEQYT